MSGKPALKPLKAFRAVGDDLASESAVRKLEGYVQLHLGNVNPDDVTVIQEKSPADLNIVNAGFQHWRARDAVRAGVGKTGEVGAVSTSRAFMLKGRRGIL